MNKHPTSTTDFFQLEVVVRIYFNYRLVIWANNHYIKVTPFVRIDILYYELTQRINTVAFRLQHLRSGQKNDFCDNIGYENENSLRRPSQFLRRPLLTYS